MKTKQQKRKEADERNKEYAALPLVNKIAIAGAKQCRKNGWVK